MTNSNAQRTPRVLLVDDDEIVPVVLRHFAVRFGFELEFIHAEDMQQGIDRLNESCFDAAIIDVILPGVTGVQLGDLVREHDPHIPLAYLTNLNSDQVRTSAAAHGARFLLKHQFLDEPGNEGVRRLLGIIDHLAHLNPCLDGGIRIDSQGFQRKLPKTPIEMPDPFAKLLNHSKALSRAA